MFGTHKLLKCLNLLKFMEVHCTVESKYTLGAAKPLRRRLIAVGALYRCLKLSATDGSVAERSYERSRETRRESQDSP